MRSSILKALALAISTGMVAPIGSVMAQDAPPAIRIPIAGLDLTSAAGRKILDFRIKMAAERLCGPYIVGTLLRPTRCIKNAEQSAQPARDWLIAERQAALNTSSSVPAPVRTAQIHADGDSFRQR
ncbi:UrcA family protein [Sphingomonas sp.]|uniref:UrcA family protein n=1 Tax=Sphingomonas sp. TaxID=28214 RepID=UPI003B3A9E86